MKVELINNFFLDVSPSGCILYQRYTAKSKDGTEHEARKKKGYYKDVEDALAVFVRQNQIAEFGDLHTYLAHYAEKVEKSNRKAVEALGSIWRGIEGKRGYEE